MAIKGTYGTPVSFHEGNTGKTCIVMASGTNADHMVADLMKAGEQQQGYCYSDIPPTATVRRESGRIYVTGEGGNAKMVISAMADALSPLPEDTAQAQLAPVQLTA